MLKQRMSHIFGKVSGHEADFLRWWWDDPQGWFGPGFHRRISAKFLNAFRRLIPSPLRHAVQNLWWRARTPADWGRDERPSQARLVVEYVFVTFPAAVKENFVVWWGRATGPLDYDREIEPLASCLRRRARIWAPVLAVVSIMAGALALHLYAGWRARDFAARALRSVGEGHWHLARLQASSAYTLRSRDPQVLLARAMVESLVGNPSAPRAWEELPPGTFLSHEEMRQRAKTMSRFGSTEQHRTALEQLDRVGLLADASGLRAEKYTAYGNLGRAITEARNAVGTGGNPEHKLALARLLVWRYGPADTPVARMTPAQLAAVEEIVGLIDDLEGTPQEGAARALGLAKVPVHAEKARAWALAAWRDPSPSNPALLTAGTVLVKLGDFSPEEMKDWLRPVFENAPLQERAAFSGWLLSNGWPQRALAVISAKDAAQDPAAFVVRADSLTAINRWPVMLAMAEEAANAPASLRFLTRALAAKNLDRPGESKKAVQDALRAALREGTLAECLRSVDAMNESTVADEVLVEMCGQAGDLNRVFPLARDRFSRRGQAGALERAFTLAASQATEVAPVKDYARYLDLLAGRPVSLEETAAAVEEDPGSTDFRMTHALALLLAGRSHDARAVFDDIDVFVYRLSPSQKAITAAIFASTGEFPAAAAAVRGLNPDLLTKEEYLFLKRSTMRLSL